MKAALDEWSLVVVGKWNVAILSPEWLAREVFKQAEINIMYPILGDIFPVFEANDMRVLARPDRLIITPLKEDSALLDRIESAAINVLDILKHTPISAFGQNFHYVLDAPEESVASATAIPDAERIDREGRVTAVSVKRSIDIDEHCLNLTIVSGRQKKIELNYHYAVSDATAATTALRGTFAANFEHGLNLLRRVYELELARETEVKL
jgi:hypothetical protein